MANRYITEAEVEPESDPFAVFESLPEIVAFVHKQEGDKTAELLLRALIHPHQPRPLSREELEETATDLALLGFKTLAIIARAVAKDAKPRAEIHACPHSPSDGLHWTSWWKSQGLKPPKWAKGWSLERLVDQLMLAEGQGS